MAEPLISFEQDQWLQDNYYHSPRLVIKLNNGKTVYSDDDRPGLEEPSFWERLQTYLKDKKNLRIDEILLQFRSNIISPLPKKAKCYFFRRGLHAIFQGPILNYYIVGYLDGEMIKSKKYLLPALLLEEEKDRPVKDCEESLIWSVRS